MFLCILYIRKLLEIQHYIHWHFLFISCKHPQHLPMGYSSHDWNWCSTINGQFDKYFSYCSSDNVMCWWWSYLSEFPLTIYISIAFWVLYSCKVCICGAYSLHVIFITYLFFLVICGSWKLDSLCSTTHCSVHMTIRVGAWSYQKVPHQNTFINTIK